MIKTTDLNSYISGYDQYCEEIENENRVPYNDYEKLEDKIQDYECLIDDIESVLEEKTTAIERIKLVKALIEDFKEN